MNRSTSSPAKRRGSNAAGGGVGIQKQSSKKALTRRRLSSGAATNDRSSSTKNNDPDWYVASQRSSRTGTSSTQQQQQQQQQEETKRNKSDTSLVWKKKRGTSPSTQTPRSEQRRWSLASTCKATPETPQTSPSSSRGSTTSSSQSNGTPKSPTSVALSKMFMVRSLPAPYQPDLFHNHHNHHQSMPNIHLSPLDDDDNSHDHRKKDKQNQKDKDPSLSAKDVQRTRAASLGEAIQSLPSNIKSIAEASEAGENSIISFQQHHESMPNLCFEDPDNYFEYDKSQHQLHENSKTSFLPASYQTKQTTQQQQERPRRRNSDSAPTRKSKPSQQKTKPLEPPSSPSNNTDKCKKQHLPASKTANKNKSSTVPSPATRRQRVPGANRPEELSVLAQQQPPSQQRKQKQQRQVRFTGLPEGQLDIDHDKDMGLWYRREVLLYREQNSLVMSSSAREALESVTTEQLEECRKSRDRLYQSFSLNADKEEQTEQDLLHLCQAYEVTSHSKDDTTTTCLRGLEVVFAATALQQLQQQHVQQVLQTQAQLAQRRNDNNNHALLLLRQASLLSSRAAQQFAIQMALYDTHESLKAILSQW